MSSISKVPQAKIYHVLEQLHDKGLVVILPEFPKKYAPVPFEEYLGRLYDEHAKAARAIDEQRGELAEMFRVVGDTDIGDRGFFTVIRGRRNVLAKIEEMIAHTARDLVILGTPGTAGRAAHMLAELRRARGREVRVRMLAPLDAGTHEKLAPLCDVAELRARDLGEAEQSAKVAIVISDSTRAFLIHFVPDDANLSAGKDIGVFTDQEAMVAAIQAIVEPHWSRAAPIEGTRAIAITSERGASALHPADLGMGRLFGLVHDAVLVVDAEGSVMLWNPAAETLFRKPALDVIGGPVADLFAPEGRAEVVARIDKARRASAGREVAERIEARASIASASAAIELTILGLDTARGPHALLIARLAPVSEAIARPPSGRPGISP